MSRLVPIEIIPPDHGDESGDNYVDRHRKSFETRPPKFDVHINDLCGRELPQKHFPFMQAEVQTLSGRWISILFYAGGFCVYACVATDEFYIGPCLSPWKAQPLEQVQGCGVLNVPPAPLIMLSASGEDEFLRAYNDAEEIYRREKAQWCRNQRARPHVARKIKPIMIIHSVDAPVICDGLEMEAGTNFDERNALIIPDEVDACGEDIVVSFADTQMIALHNLDAHLSRVILRSKTIYRDANNEIKRISKRDFSSLSKKWG